MARSLKKRTISVPIEKEDGTEVEYELRDMNGLDRDAFVSFIGTKLVRDDKGNPTGGVKDDAGVSIDILSRTLFDEKGKKVPKAVLQEWPARLLEELSSEAQALCGLGKKAEVQEGNV